MVPLVGATASQLPPEVVDGVAVKLGLPLVVETEIVCEAGLPPPAWPAKVRDGGPTVSEGWAETVRVTG